MRGFEKVRTGYRSNIFIPIKVASVIFNPYLKLSNKVQFIVRSKLKKMKGFIALPLVVFTSIVCQYNPQI